MERHHQWGRGPHYPLGPPPPPYAPRNTWLPAPSPPRRSRWFAVLSPRRAARSIFDPPGLIDDPVIRQVQFTRAVVGVAATFWIVYTYGTDGGWSGLLNEGTFRLFVAPWLLILTGPLAIAAFIRYAPRERRPLLRSRLRSPLKALGWYLGAVALLIGLLYGMKVTQDGTLDIGGLASVLTSLGVLPLIIWLLGFILQASAKVARNAFNTAQVHAALPAVLTVVLVWELMLIQLMVDGPPHGPPTVRMGSMLGGPASVTAVAWWELRRLRARHGITVRG